MSFHRSGISDPVAVSYNANLMAPRSPNRKYNTANSNMSTSTIASSTSAPKYLSCRSPGTIDRTNFSTSTSNYKTSSRRIHSSPARSVSSYSDVGLVTSSGINLPPKYSSTSTSSASSTTSSASSNAREYNGISSLTSSEFYAKYSPTNYIPNIHGSSSSLSTSSSSSTLNGFYRPSYQPSSIPIDSIESDGSNEYDTTPNCSRRSIDRQIKRRNTSIITVRTGHDQIDSAAAPIEVKQQQKQQQKQKQQHEENEIRNNINRIISDDDDNDTNNNNNNNNSNSNNNGNNNDGDLVDVNVARINIRVDNNDKDDDNLNHHHNNNHHHHHHHYLTLADGTQKFTTNPSITSFLSSCSFTTSVSSPSTSPNYPNSQFFDSIAPSISTASASVSATTAITITSTTITTTITATVTATATATTATTTTTTTTTTTHASATTSAVDSVGASITDCSAYCWIETPTNTNNTSLLTNNNDDICNEFCIAKQTVNEEVLSSITDAIGLPINDVNTDGEIDQTDIQAHENDRLFIINDPSSGNIPHPINDTRSIKYLDNDTKSEIIYSQDGNIQLINKPIDNHGNDSSKPSTSRRTTFSNLDDTLSGDTFNASTSNNTSNVPVGVHQAFLRESNDQIEESSTSRLSRNRIQSRRGEGLNGLRNIGNTCFMNSVIQCMSNTRPLLEYLLNEQYMLDINTTTSSMKGALIKAFAQVIHELWESSGERDVNTSSLKTQIQRFAPRFMGYAQQDAQEFLRYLLEGLHEDVNRVAIKPQPILTDIPDHYTDSQKAAESWKRYLHSEDSTIVDVFVGQLRSSLTCTSCDHVSVTLDPFWDLSLPIPGRSGTVKLNQCLEHFTKVETLDGDEKPICSKCQMRTKCTKSFSIQKFPKILVIHLKRFSPTERYRAKLSVLVDFPLMVLDLSAFAAPGVRGCTYNLYGVANHSGTPYSGHYTAYCKHPYSGDWHEYNDSRVSSVSTNSIVSSEAYLLFYEQQPLSHHL